MTDTADYIVAGLGSFFDKHHFHRVGGVVRTQDQVAIGYFHVFDGAGIVFANGVHVLFTLAVGSQRVVVTVEEQGGAGEHAGIHAHAFAGVYLDDDEALPAVPVTLYVFAQPAEKGLLEFQDFLDVHVHDKGFLGSDLGVGDHHAVEFVGAGRDDRGALVDLRGVEQVEHGNVLHGQNFVHAFQAESALAIEEVGDVGLLEAGLLRQTQAGEVAFFNALPKSLAEIVL